MQLGDVVLFTHGPEGDNVGQANHVPYMDSCIQEYGVCFDEHNGGMRVQFFGDASARWWIPYSRLSVRTLGEAAGNQHHVFRDRNGMLVVLEIGTDGVLEAHRLNGESCSVLYPLTPHRELTDADIHIGLKIQVPYNTECGLAGSYGADLEVGDAPSLGMMIRTRCGYVLYPHQVFYAERTAGELPVRTQAESLTEGMTVSEYIREQIQDDSHAHPIEQEYNKILSACALMKFSDTWSSTKSIQQRDIKVFLRNRRYSDETDRTLRLVLKHIYSAAEDLRGSDTTAAEAEFRKRCSVLLTYIKKWTARERGEGLFSTTLGAHREIRYLISYIPVSKRPVYLFPTRVLITDAPMINTLAQYMPRGKNLRPVHGVRVPQKLCSTCNRVTEKTNTVELENASVCLECAHVMGLRRCNYTVLDERCPRYHREGDLACSVHSCYFFRCSFTGEVTRTEFMEVYRNRRINRAVRTNGYTRECDNCSAGTDIHTAHPHGAWNWFCETCHEEADAPRALNCYSYKPTPDFRRSTKDPKNERLFMGLELELETDPDLSIESAARAFNKAFGSRFAYCKTDGSINHGLEIVTHPASLNHWVHEADGFFNAIKAITESHKAHSARTVGIHIHVSRDAFTSKQHIRRFSLFFTELYRRHPRTHKILVGREPGYYCRELEQLRRRPRDTARTAHLKAIPDIREKYSQVNTGLNSTVEVRAFASYTEKADILRCIEFVHAVFMFTKHEVSLPVLVDRSKKFLTWFTGFSRRMQYKNLCACFDANSIR